MNIEFSMMIGVKGGQRRNWKGDYVPDAKVLLCILEKGLSICVLLIILLFKRKRKYEVGHS